MIRSGSINLTWNKTIGCLAAVLCSFWVGHAQQVDYRQQEIEIRNAVFSDGIKRAGESGILFTADVKFRYSTQQVNGALDGQNPKEYHFFLELFDANGNKAFYPSAIPDRLKKSVTRDEYVMLTADHTDWQYLRIFIPYNRIHLPEGLQRVKLQLNVSNNEGTFYFNNLYVNAVSVNQPVIYIAKVVTGDIHIKEKEYDLPGKKIPIIGLFLGGDKSKSGQGLPDAGWKIRVGGDVVYESEVVSNSYDVPSANASFRVAKGDPVELLVIDEDYFKSDEVLGSFRFSLEQDAGKIEKKNYAFGDITSGTFYYQQTREPRLSGVIVTYEEKEFQGVTGIEVKARYQLSELLPGDAVAMRPVFRDNLGRVTVPEFIKLVDVHMEVGKSGLLVESQNGADEQTIFIPHYAIPGNVYPGMEFRMDGYNITIQSAFANQLVKPFVAPVHDVKIAVGKTEETSYKGYWGLKVPLSIRVPDMYYDDLDFTALTHSIMVKNSKGFDITDSILLVTLKDEPNLRNFQLRKINKDRILFLPYSRCVSDDQPTEFTIHYKTRYWKKGIIIGESASKHTVENPSLIKPNPFQVSYRLKKKNIEYSYYIVYHGNREIFRSEKVSKGKLKNVLDFSKRWFSLYDDITVEVMAVDYFAHESSVYKYTFTPYLLSRNIFPPYDTPKSVKGFRIARKKL